MRLSSEHVIAGRPEAVFAALSDFDHYEGLVRRRVPDLDRVSASGEAPVWRGRAEVRGMMRDVTVEVVAAEAPGTLRLSGQVGGLSSLFEVTLAPEGADATRVRTALTLRATSLKARAVLMSLTVTRGGFEQRYGEVMARMARDLAERVSAASDRPDRPPEA